MNLEAAKKISDLLWQITSQKLKVELLQNKIDSVKNGDRTIILTFGFMRRKKDGQPVEEAIHTTSHIHLHQHVLLDALEKDLTIEKEKLALLQKDMEEA